MRESTGSSLHNINRSSWLYVVCRILPVLQGLSFEHRPCSLVAVHVPSLDDVNAVFLDQICEFLCHTSLFIVVFTTDSVKGSMCSHNNPLNFRVSSGFLQVLLQKVVLWAAWSIWMLGGNMSNVDLPIFEGEPQILTTPLRPRQVVTVLVGSIVVVLFVVSHSWHEGHHSSPLLSDLPKQIPDGLHLSDFFGVHAGVGDVPGQQYEVQRVDEVGPHNLIGDRETEWSNRTHIAENREVHPIQVVEGSCLEGLDFGELVGLEVANLVVVPLSWLQPLHNRSIDAPMESNMPHIILIPLPILKVYQLERSEPIPDNRPELLLRLGHPHNLHFRIVPGEPNVDLFWAGPQLRVEVELFEHCLELVQLHPPVCVEVVGEEGVVGF